MPVSNLYAIHAHQRASSLATLEEARLERSLLALSAQLRRAYLSPNKERRDLEISLVFLELGNYQSSKKKPLKKLAARCDKVAHLIRYQHENQLKQALTYLITCTETLTSDEKEEMIKWTPFALGSTTNAGIPLEYDLESLATDLNQTERKLAKHILLVNRHARDLHRRLLLLSRSLAGTMENHYVAIIRAINTAQEKPRSNGHDVLTSLTYEMLSGFTERQRAQFLPKIQRFLATVFPVVEHLNRLTTSYEALYKQRLQKLHEARALLQQHDPLLIFYFAKHNKKIRALLEHTQIKDWTDEIASKLGVEKSAQYEPIASSVDAVFQIGNAATSAIFDTVLTSPKSPKTDAARYSCLSDFIREMKGKVAHPVNLDIVIGRHHEIRQKLYSDSIPLPEEAVDVLISSAKTGNLSFLFNQNEEARSSHGTPALINSCLNKIAVSYALLKSYDSIKIDTKKESLRKASLFYMLSALLELVLAKKLESASYASITHLTRGKSLFQFFIPYLPSPIRSWQEAKARLTHQIKETFDVEIDCDTEDSITLNVAKASGRYR